MKRHNSKLTVLLLFLLFLSMMSSMELKVDAASISGINLYGQRAANHCAEASLACVEAKRIGLNQADNAAIYWACWAVTGGGAYMPSDGVIEIGKNASSICQQIDAGKPVLLYFNNWSGQDSNHWVVAYGYDSNNILIMCPAHDGKGNPTAFLTTKSKTACNSSSLTHVYIVNGGFVQSVSGNTVIADGAFLNYKTTFSGNDATISCSMRNVGSAGHDCNDVGFIISNSSNMSSPVIKYESEKSQRNAQGVFPNVISISYSMNRWYGSLNSNQTYYYQFFVIKNGITIKSLPRKLGEDLPITAPQTISVTGVSLNKTSITVTSGESYQLSATASPKNATNKNVTWSTSNASIAKVSSNGIVTGVAVGKATITATAADGSNKKAICNVTVNATVITDGLNIESDGDCYLYKGGKVDTSFNDLYYDYTYGWRIVFNGKVDPNYNDLFCSPTYGWWKVANGTLDYTYNDMYYSPTYGWWKIENGQINVGYNDLYYSPTIGWWKIVSGTLDCGYNDMYYSPTYGWWKIENGQINVGYNDLYCSPTIGWWKVVSGTLDCGYNDMYYSPTYGWWMIENGQINVGYNDLYYSPSIGWWKVTSGTLDYTYNEMYCSPRYGWWKIADGHIDTEYNDLYYSSICGWLKIVGGSYDMTYNDLFYSPRYGWWKITDGAIDVNYSGSYYSSLYNVTWTISNGSVVF